MLDKQSFFGAMAQTIELLKSNLAFGIKGKLSVEEKRRMDYMGISETAFNINRVWFAPPTAFRMLPSVKKYL